MKKSIDLNCDVAELDHINDLDFIPYVSSVNICCGDHAGNPEKILNAIRAAKKHGVKIGAHPSYPDRKNFGRKSIDIPTKDLVASLMEQIIYIQMLCDKENAVFHHVKPHGALYHDVIHMDDRLEVLLDVMAVIDKDLKFYGFAHKSLQEKVSARDFKFVAESFVDRKYGSDGMLLSREQDDAVHSEWGAVKAQLDQWFKVPKNTETSSTSAINIETLCIHSDTPNASLWIKNIVEHLQNKGIEIH